MRKPPKKGGCRDFFYLWLVLLLAFLINLPFNPMQGQFQGGGSSDASQSASADLLSVPVTMRVGAARVEVELPAAA